MDKGTLEDRDMPLPRLDSVFVERAGRVGVLVSDSEVGRVSSIDTDGNECCKGLVMRARLNRSMCGLSVRNLVMWIEAPFSPPELELEFDEGVTMVMGEPGALNMIAIDLVGETESSE